MPIYIENPTKIKFKDIVHLIECSFNPDIFTTNFRPTYHDEECTHLQCKQAFRSFEDLLILCKTYFPETTKEELAYVLVNRLTRTQGLYCPDICKPTFFNSSEKGSWIHSLYTDKTHKFGNSDYSLDLIAELAEQYDGSLKEKYAK